jgi:hypothetical protein
MNKKIAFVVVQVLGFITSRSAFSQISSDYPTVSNKNLGTLLSERIGDGTGTCVGIQSREAAIENLKKMNQDQVESIFNSLKTLEEKEDLLQLLEEVQ